VSGSRSITGPITRPVNGPNGARTAQYIRTVDSVNAYTGNGLLQCQGEGTADESGSIDGDSAWKAAIHHHFNLSIVIFRL
jgi:hypothetical protein